MQVALERGGPTGRLTWLHRDANASLECGLFLLFNGDIVAPVDGDHVRVLVADSANATFSAFGHSGTRIFCVLGEDPRDFLPSFPCCLQAVNKKDAAVVMCRPARQSITTGHITEEDVFGRFISNFAKVKILAQKMAERIIKYDDDDSRNIEPQRRSPWIPERHLELGEPLFRPGNPLRYAEDDLGHQVFCRGIDPIHRRELWPLVLGPLNSSDDIGDAPVDSEQRTRIEKDVNRVDAILEGIPGAIPALQQVLESFCREHEYVQGMCDLAIPFVRVFPSVNLASSYFARFMNAGMLANFAPDSRAIEDQLSLLAKVIGILAPDLYDYFMAEGLSSLFFAYRWFLVRFRREFHALDVELIWEASSS